MDELDIAFVEGAIASEEQARELREIRQKAKKLVAVGACAVVGMPSAQRNYFNEEQKKEIQFLIDRFAALPKVQKVSEVVPVDAEIPGCPMDPNDFLAKVNALVNEFNGSTRSTKAQGRPERSRGATGTSAMSSVPNGSPQRGRS